jgi:hypothetical protein
MIQKAFSSRNPVNQTTTMKLSFLKFSLLRELNESNLRVLEIYLMQTCSNLRMFNLMIITK